MGSFLVFAVLVFVLGLIGADVPTDISPNTVYYNTKNSTQGSVFIQNVVSSLDFITKQAPVNSGSADYKLGNGSDTVWSRGECYNLTEGFNCGTCLGSARDQIKQKAPLSVGARIWINSTTQRCYLHYQNFAVQGSGLFTIFSEAPAPAPAPAPPPAAPAPPGIDIAPNMIYWNTKNAENGSIYMKNVDVVVGYLLENTPSNGTTSYNYGDYPYKVWGEAKCFDMPQFCESCIQNARDNIYRAAPLAVGGQFWNNSTNDRCFFRYENYKFLAGKGHVDFVSHFSQTSDNLELLKDPPVSPPAPLPHSPPPGVSLPATRRDSSKTKIVVGASVGAAAVLGSGVWILFFVKRGSRQKLNGQPFLRDAEIERSHEGPVVFTLEQLKTATKNFSDENKLGQGGFGAVYKAIMKDGTQLAVKRLSLISQQGRQEFVNEIQIITNIQHRNLVRLKGYCIEESQKLLVYEFLENGSLDNALFSANPGVRLDWRTRFNIAISIARGLAYLHEESQVLIIHRDIKASNILLDRKLNPKVSDFGISKLFDLEKSYTSTKIAGTRGYLAPEYALWGRLTVKADVYSFGVLLLEIISGRKCHDPTLPDCEQLLLQWTWSLNQSGRLHEVVDKRLTSNSSETIEPEVLRVIQVALVCTHNDEYLRPIMSDAVAMLLGYLEIPPQMQAPAYLPQTIPLRRLSQIRDGSSEGSLQESISELETR